MSPSWKIRKFAGYWCTYCQLGLSSKNEMPKLTLTRLGTLSAWLCSAWLNLGNFSANSSLLSGVVCICVCTHFGKKNAILSISIQVWPSLIKFDQILSKFQQLVSNLHVKTQDSSKCSKFSQNVWRWKAISRTEYDWSGIFDIRPKPKFSFKKIRPSA